MQVVPSGATAKISALCGVRRKRKTRARAGLGGFRTEMSEVRNLTLDLDTDIRPGENARLRIAVAEVWGFTRHGGTAIVTRDCSGIAALEREVERLKGELDAALAEAGKRLGGHAAAAPRAEAPAATQAAPRISPLDTGLHVRDVMTREVRTLGPNDRLSLAEELMQQGRFRHVVVVDDRRVVGVLSQRDIFFGALAWSLGHGRKAREQLLAATAVKDVMASRVVSIDPDAPLGDAAALLREHKIGCLPVVAGDELVGILTEGDFLALIAKRG
ncbi:MAG TPA: CBS domain-containing protein [Myxococcota bacterium]|nr:CBS domain-containing protein [Myxococcota bacterium]